jgi:hypothetical protein
LPKMNTMEQWSVGVLGLVELDLFLYEWYRVENKIDHHPIFIPNIPLLHHSPGFLTAKAITLEIYAHQD